MTAQTFWLLYGTGALLYGIGAARIAFFDDDGVVSLRDPIAWLGILLVSAIWWLALLNTLAMRLNPSESEDE